MDKLSLTDLLLLRKWLRACYQTCMKKQNESGAAELAALEQKVCELIAITPSEREKA